MQTLTGTVRSHDGTPISYYRAGEGPPLVLVHGAGAANPTAWPVFPWLTQDFTVYAISRRGHGKSGDGPKYAVEREFEDVAAMVDALDAPANLLGHSFGGMCALEASLLTRHIQKLVLYEPLSIPSPGKPVYPDGFIERLQAMLDAGNLEGVVMLHYREIAGMREADIEQLRASPVWPERVAAASTLPRELRADQRYHLDARRYRDMDIPTLLVLGGASRESEKRGIALLADALPNNRVAVLPEEGHIAMYTAPELFLNEVRTFLVG